MGHKNTKRRKNRVTNVLVYHYSTPDIILAICSVVFWFYTEYEVKKNWLFPSAVNQWNLNIRIYAYNWLLWLGRILLLTVLWSELWDSFLHVIRGLDWNWCRRILNWRFVLRWPGVVDETVKLKNWVTNLQNTLEIKRTLFNWTKQDKTCKFSRKSSFPSYVQHKNSRKKIRLLNCLFFCFMLYVAWKRVLPWKFARSALFRSIKKRSFNPVSYTHLTLPTTAEV